MMFPRVLVLSIVLLLGLNRRLLAQDDMLASSPVPIQWTEAATGVWKAIVGRPEPVSLLGAADIQPRQKALERMGSTPFPLDRGEIKATVLDGKLYLQALDKEMRSVAMAEVRKAAWY